MFALVKTLMKRIHLIMGRATVIFLIRIFRAAFWRRIVLIEIVSRFAKCKLRQAMHTTLKSSGGEISAGVFCFLQLIIIIFLSTIKLSRSD